MKLLHGVWFPNLMMVQIRVLVDKSTLKDFLIFLRFKSAVQIFEKNI